MSHDDELGQAVDAYLEADAAARACSREAYAAQAYKDAAKARWVADKRLVRLLKYRGKAFTHAGFRWAVTPEGDLSKVEDGGSHRFNNRDYSSPKAFRATRSEA